MSLTGLKEIDGDAALSADERPLTLFDIMLSPKKFWTTELICFKVGSSNFVTQVNIT